MADDDVLLVDVVDRVATVTLNRPGARNALNRDLRKALHRAVLDLDADDGIDVLILTGADPAFCAGLDLKELGSSAGASVEALGGSDVPPQDRGPFPPTRKLVIGAINGVAITGGFEVALRCDLLVASERARFADTHARVGITPGWGLSQKLSRCIGPYRAKELSLTGNFLSAQQAYDWGLVNRVVAPEELMPAALKLASEMASIEADMLVTYKAMIDDGYAATLGDGLELEHQRSVVHNREVTPDMVAARREKVQARGRMQ
jgi:enoyl-CoA hydratase